MKVRMEILEESPADAGTRHVRVRLNSDDFEIELENNVALGLGVEEVLDTFLDEFKARRGAWTGALKVKQAREQQQAELVKTFKPLAKKQVEKEVVD